MRPGCVSLPHTCFIMHCWLVYTKLLCTAAATAIQSRWPLLDSLVLVYVLQELSAVIQINADVGDITDVSYLPALPFRTRSSDTAEKQLVSGACLSRLANWSCNALNIVDVVQLDHSFVVSTVSAKKASDIRGRWSFLALYTHIRLSRSTVCVSLESR